MEEKREAASTCLSRGGEKKNGVYYPMYFGLSCAFAAVRLLSSNTTNTVAEERTAVMRKMVEGSAQLLGMLVWDAQRQARIGGESDALRKLHQAQSEVEEMKRRRREDARANAKVVAIYASQEQSWLTERKKLVQHLRSAAKSFHELRAKTRSDCAEKENVICNLNEALLKKEPELQKMAKALGEEKKRREETDKKLEREEAVARELRQMLDREAREHSSEIWKHKTAFVELVSSQRQLEAELTRVLKQIEAGKLEFDTVLRQKEDATEMVDKFSVELARMQKDAEQKDKIVSSMSRKFRLDSEEKQKLVKELKIMRTNQRQTEMETKRLAKLLESEQTSSCKHGKNLKKVSSFKHDLISEINLEKPMHCIDYDSSHNICQRNENQPNCIDSSPTKKNAQKSSRKLSVEYLEPEIGNGHDSLVMKETNTWKVDSFAKDSSVESSDLVITASIRQLEDMVQLETEKYISILEQRHDDEIQAFSEQMKLKDEKLEAFHWQLHSMEPEFKGLHSHIDELNEKLSQRSENLRLEALLLGKEKDLKAINEKYAMHIKNSQSDATGWEVLPVSNQEAVWSEVKNIRRNTWRNEQKHRPALVAASEEVDGETQERQDCLAGKRKVVQGLQSTSTFHERERKETGTEIIPVDATKTELFLPYDMVYSNPVKNMGSSPCNEAEDERIVNTVIEMRKCKIIQEVQETEKVCMIKNGNLEENPQAISMKKNQNSEAIPFPSQCMLKKDGSSKDIHVLAVSYKIKRLKQQFFIIERLTETNAEKHDIMGSVYSPERTNLLWGIALLKKQLKRYQTLEEKIDDLCNRMHLNHQDERSKYSDGRRKVQSRALERFLEEAFQLQRYMVATGQKLVEIMSETTCTLVESFEKVDGFSAVDVNQFTDRIKTLLKEIQRGLEVRLARVIGDIEGTLACEGFLHL